jgi:4-hydroxy-tetrahydrodipicolinate reductase
MYEEQKMNIGIIGYGRMGKTIERLAKERGHKVSYISDIDNPLTESSDVGDTQVFIDFSIQQTVKNNSMVAAKMGIPIVQGTTGWMDEFDDICAIENLSMLYSPNFSLGVHLFHRIAEYSAKLFGAVKSYDCYLHEFHHTGKADSPSGTALSLANVLIQNLPDKNTVLSDKSQGKVSPDALHVSSTRSGRIPGIHEIGFDSDFDAITLKHSAHSRDGFAFGAVRAAEWMKDKQGIYDMKAFMNDILNRD